MTAEKTRSSENSIRQAELILKLYELRREAVMREARSYVGGPFLPASTKEFIEIVSAGGRQTGFVLQVYGYWDMVAAFVHHGALDAQLVYDTCQEMYFQYAKIQPYLTEFRKLMKLPEFLSNIERLIEESERGRQRIAAMRNNIAAIADVRAEAKQPQGE